MNILYLCDEYPPGLHGGIGTSVRLLAREMVKLGHRVVVAGLYSLGYGGENEFYDEGVKVYRFRRLLDSNWFKNQHSLSARVSIRLLKDTGIIEWDIRKSLAVYKKQLEQIITDYQIDIVEMPDYNDYIRFCNSYIPFPILSVPVIVKMHGSITYCIKGANQQAPAHIVKMEQTILRQAAAVASVSKYTAHQSAIYLSYPNPIEVLYNGINTDIPSGNDSKKPKQVIFTGALVRQKGIYQLAKAWNIVNKNVPDARLLIFGKGPQQKVKAYLTAAAGNSVSFMGYVETEKLYEYLAASVISVFPSYSEAFALAPLEAMAYSAAVINSNRTSGPELIDDKINGLLIDPDNIEQIASSIIYLLNNPAHRLMLSKNGNEKVIEQFGIGKIAAKNIQFYNEILGRVKL
jgi:glycogen(starch) synthase